MCLTPCPHGTVSESGIHVRVGSHYCGLCIYNAKPARKENIVYCSKDTGGDLHTGDQGPDSVETGTVPQTHESNGTKNMRDGIEKVCAELSNFLAIKNRRYGNSALEPINVFSKADAGSSIRVRINDKLSRIRNGESLRKNDVVDLAGYLVLLMVEQGWDDFGDMLD